MAESIAAHDITGLILAGGRGSRMGGIDKGLQRFGPWTLVENALARLRSSGAVGTIAVNANRNLPEYARLGVSVWPDCVEGYAGPLAGFLTGLRGCQTPWMLTVPCDTPLFPKDIVLRLATELVRRGGELAMAASPQATVTGVKTVAQPVFCLIRTSLQDDLAEFIETGGRKVEAWCARHRPVMVAFDRPGDDPQAFVNINTLDELALLVNATQNSHL